MHKSSIICLIILFLSLFLLTAGCTQEKPEIIPLSGENTEVQQDTYTSNATLIAFVDRAAVYAKTNGREKALAEFNDLNGSFIEGELYIYAYDFNGTTLAHPVNPEMIGINRLDEGETGVYLSELIESVKNGDGFNQIEYINPAHDRRLESKLVYAVEIDNEWWLGSGIYTGPVNPTSTQ